MDQEYTNIPQEEEKPKNKSPFHSLIPKGDYFFTPIILAINILIFILMVAGGAHLMRPGSDTLIKWGANTLALTMGGEPWRLFTSMFLHFGLIHLAVNMMALYSIGRSLEPFIGRMRFLLLYIFSGLGGSAVSLWWHAGDGSVSAGASGAIFGIFGVFAALLTTNLIKKEVRMEMLKSIGKAIVLNLLIGLWGGIDNAAHIGGLLTGAVGGYLCYYDVRDWYRERVQKYRGVIATGLLTAGAIAFFWMMVKNKMPVDNRTLFERFQMEEKRSLDFIDQKDTAATAEEIKQNILLPWRHNLSIIDSMTSNGLPEKNTRQLRIYTLYRLKSADEMYRSKTENRKDLWDSAMVSMNAANNIAVEQTED